MKDKRLTSLDHLNILEIGGEGAEELLQGQLTCDLSNIVENSFGLGAICNVKGRVINSFVLCKPPSYSGYWLICNNEMVGKTEEILKKYSPFYSVEMTTTNEYNFYAADADQAKTIGGVHKLQQNFYSTADNNSIVLPYLNKTLSLVVIKKNEDTFAREYSIDNQGAEWSLDNLRAKDVEIDQNNTEIYTPHELNFDTNHRVDFDKGCYTGQEIVARMHYRAKSLPRLHLVQSNGSSISPNDTVVDSENKNLGSVVKTLEYNNSSYSLIAIKKPIEEIFLKDSLIKLDYVK